MRPSIRPLAAGVALLAMVLLVACQSSGKDASTSTHPATGRTAGPTTSEEPSDAPGVYTPVDRDHDNDVAAEPHDDTSNQHSYGIYGPLASARLAREIGARVKRYYRLALEGDGPGACAMIIAPLVRAIPEDYGETGGIAAMHGATSCREGMSRMFASIHAKLARVVPSMRVLQVRLHGKFSTVVLDLGHVEREIKLMREGGVWKLAVLFDSFVS